jgi:hypothetical protein
MQQRSRPKQQQQLSATQHSQHTATQQQQLPVQAWRNVIQQEYLQQWQQDLRVPSWEQQWQHQQQPQLLLQGTDFKAQLLQQQDRAAWATAGDVAGAEAGAGDVVSGAQQHQMMTHQTTPARMRKGVV